MSKRWYHIVGDDNLEFGNFCRTWNVLEKNGNIFFYQTDHNDIETKCDNFKDIIWKDCVTMFAMKKMLYSWWTWRSWHNGWWQLWILGFFVEPEMLSREKNGKILLAKYFICKTDHNDSETKMIILKILFEKILWRCLHMIRMLYS